MNSESFAEYLAQPAKLYQLSYQEIKNLVEDYPYAGNLRLLMYIKSKIEQDPSHEKHLHELAAHSFDRDFLFDLTQQELKEMLDLSTGLEDKLELQDLSMMEEKEMVPIDASIKEDHVPLAESALAVPVTDNILAVQTENLVVDQGFEEDEGVLPDEIIEQPLEESPISPIVAPPITEAVPIINTIKSGYQLQDELLETMSVFPILYTDGQPQSKSDFRSWRYYLESKQENRLKNLRKKARQSLKGFELKTAQEVAAKSVQQKSNVATETLAKLLKNQGNYVKAIRMYEQLILLHPDKRSYFNKAISILKENN